MTHTLPRLQTSTQHSAMRHRTVAMSPGEDGLIGIPFPEHSSELLNRLNAQRRAGLLCDLTLTSRGSRYPTHRSVMAAVSLYFRRLFGADEAEDGGCEGSGAGVGTSCSVCQLDCVAPDALDALLEFAYTATLTIRSSGMREVLKGAQLLGIQCVADACRDILGEAADEAEPEAAAVATEERGAAAHRVSRRKRDRRHVPKAASPARSLWQQQQQRVQEPPPTLVTGLSRPSHGLPLTPTPGRDEHNLHPPHPAGYNGDAQGSQLRALVNGGAHWHQEGTPMPPAADDAVSEKERRLEVGVIAQAPITERAATAGGAGAPSGRKRKSQTPQQCPVCQKIIHGAGKLPRHMRTHTGEKPFQCTACGVRFTRNDKLKIHMRKHTGERPYPCPKCNARFLHSYDLKNHLSLHSGARPFECPQCHKAFAREDHLQRHRKGHSCLELRTRRPRRASGLAAPGGEGTSDGGGGGGGGAGGVQQGHLESPLTLQAHPRSSPGLARSLAYPDSAQHLPLQALPLLGHRMAGFAALWPGMGGLREEGVGGSPSPSPHHSRPPLQGWDGVEDEEDEEEEEGEDEGEEEGDEEE
ncbi:zinc finger and BTB domain-containing protein 7B isoform X1 [Alosa pseudoharengus]|uniref:zinc finger and BTB domain-containing protein 7B isoform X1 n=2 Tax=Alosa pseudoharengus TaxID=34774 RepID=UPI003F89A3FC